jgi:hypothetical protein
MRGNEGSKYIIDYRPGDEDEENVVWIWEHKRGRHHSTVARYKMQGTIEQQINSLIKLSNDYNKAVVRVDLTYAGSVTVDILEENGIETSTYYTVSHVGQRE